MRKMFFDLVRVIFGIHPDEELSRIEIAFTFFFVLFIITFIVFLTKTF